MFLLISFKLLEKSIEHHICYITSINQSINQSIYIYIIAEAKRKWIPTIKEVLTNKIIAYLKFRHVSLKKVIHYIVWQGEYRLTVVGYIKKKKNG